MDIAAVRAGLKAALEVVPGLRVVEFEPSSANPPVAIIEDPSINYDLTLGHGIHAATFNISVTVANVVDRDATAKMNAYISHPGPQSIKQALEYDRSLGGVIEELKVNTVTGANLEIEDAVVKQANFVVVVYAKGV